MEWKPVTKADLERLGEKIETLSPEGLDDLKARVAAVGRTFQEAADAKLDARAFVAGLEGAIGTLTGIIGEIT